MSTRKDRLKKLVRLQNQIKAFHQARHAGFLAAAAAADQEAHELADRLEAEDSLAGLFPEIYHQRIGGAIARKEERQECARTEASQVAIATARTNMVEKAYRDEMRQDERENADRERLELVERRFVTPRR